MLQHLRPQDEVLFSAVPEDKDHHYRLITLNRPKALNALNLHMIHHMTRDLRPRDWTKMTSSHFSPKDVSSNPTYPVVVLTGAGNRAFCAGGDIRAVTEAGKVGDRLAKDFFRDEYILNHLIGTYKKPFIAVIDGITMGGAMALGGTGYGTLQMALGGTGYGTLQMALGGTGYGTLQMALGGTGYGTLQMALGGTGYGTLQMALGGTGYGTLQMALGGTGYGTLQMALGGTGYGTLQMAFLGLGVGVSVHAPFRVATENTVFAMPETFIGLFPDVGGSYFLPRLNGKLGMFLALTGHRLKGKDVQLAGIATHFVSKEKVALPTCYKLMLDPASNSHQSAVRQLLDRHHQKSSDVSDKPFSLLPYMEEINSTFDKGSVEGIMDELKSRGTQWTLAQYEVTHRQLTKGANLSFEECFKMEYRISQGCMRGKDFYEGVRAVIVDKDNNPHWDPPTIAEVSEQHVDAYFEPLPNDLEL
eukprot:Em0024g61a